MTLALVPDKRAALGEWMQQMVAHIGQLLDAGVALRGMPAIYVGGGSGDSGDPVFDAVLLTLAAIAAFPLVWVCAQNVQRYFALRQNGSTSFPSVVRGSGVGLYSEPMPGTLHVLAGRLWWVAEGSSEPISLAGKQVREPETKDSVPRSLTFGIIDDPETIRVALAAGGHADLTVRGPSADQIRRLMPQPPEPGSPVPRLRGRRPLSRLALTALGVAALVLAGFYSALAGYAPHAEATVVELAVAEHADRVEWTRDGTVHSDTVDSDGSCEGDRMEVVLLPLVDEAVNPDSLGEGAFLLMLVGFGALAAGLIQLEIRRDRVRTNSSSLIRTLPEDAAAPLDGAEHGRQMNRDAGAATHADASAGSASTDAHASAVATFSEEADPSIHDLLHQATLPLTYEPIRTFLEQRRADERWGADEDPVDPHDWRRALRDRLQLPAFFAGVGLILGLPLVAWSLAPFTDPLSTWDIVCMSLLAGYLLLPLIAATRGALFLRRARNAAERPYGTGARYLLARDWADCDVLILFPTSGDVPPLGVVELQLAAATAIPASGSAWLAGTMDAQGRPADGALIVPKLSSKPVWPAERFEVLDDEDLRELVTGLDEEMLEEITRLSRTT